MKHISHASYDRLIMQSLMFSFLLFGTACTSYGQSESTKGDDEKNLLKHISHEVEEVEGKVKHISHEVEEIEKKVDHINHEVEEIEEIVESIDDKLGDCGDGTVCSFLDAISIQIGQCGDTDVCDQLADVSSKVDCILQVLANVFPTGFMFPVTVSCGNPPVIN